MIKQAISAFAAAAVAVSFASAAFATEENVIENIPTTYFNLVKPDGNSSEITSDTIKLIDPIGNDGGNNTRNIYVEYYAKETGTLSIIFEGDKGVNSGKNKNAPRLYWGKKSLISDSTPLTKNNAISTLEGDYTQSDAKDTPTLSEIPVTAGETYCIFGYSWNQTLTTTISKVQFTSTADITAATEYEPIAYSGTDKGFTANLTGSGTINWYAKSKDAESYSKIGSVSTDITGEDSTTFTAGLVISDMGDEASNYNIGASIN